ncbi:MAG: asparaginase, partial [Desulfuromonadales bacterium]|nr:asparaginase [Desulfuromonadales bacterium]
MRIRIISTGGTIDKIYFDRLSEFQIGEPQTGEVLREAHVAFDYLVEPLLRKDSLDLTDEDRRLIRRAAIAAPERHLLITHGTDTMIETARALAGIPGKVIVLTGALQPARFRPDPLSVRYDDRSPRQGPGAQVAVGLVRPLERIVGVVAADLATLR